MQIKNSQQLYEASCKYIPGGVNSPVRAFQAVGGTPPFIKRAEGAYLYDEDRNRYLDCINSWGPMILGHAHEGTQAALEVALKDSFSFGAPTRKELVMAKLIRRAYPSIEKVRMVNSGTEATMAAIRLARGFTKRDKIIKFEGCYHGHGDSFLIKAGSGALTAGEPDSAGITRNISKDTLTATFNNLESVERLIYETKNQIAAIILEPIVGNMGVVPADQTFLEDLRRLCDEHQIVLIFDEVMTGFRVALGGAQSLYNVRPDLTTLGKIIGGGLPVGAYGGRRDIMDCVAPLGAVYQAGTLSGNPLAMTAGIQTLEYLSEHEAEVYPYLESLGKTLEAGMKKHLKSFNLTYPINRVGSMLTLFFTSKSKVDNFQDAQTCKRDIFKTYFHAMLKRGIYLPPSQFEALFFSIAWRAADVEMFLEACGGSLKEK